MRIIVSSPADAPRRAGVRLSDALDAFQNEPTLLLLSGGSALSMLPYVRRESLGQNLTVSVLDERSGDPSASNFETMKSGSFYQACVFRGASFIDTKVSSGESPEVLSARMDKAFKLWRTNNRMGRVVATFGIGYDAHVAGIMPFPEDPRIFVDLFESNEILVRGYDAGQKNAFRLRATATLPLIRSVDAGIALVLGEEKRLALERVIFRNALPSAPAAVLAHIPVVELHTDIAGLPMVE